MDYRRQPNQSNDPKDFLIEKSERLKGYLDDYIDILKQEKQREREEKIQKSQREYLR